MAANVKKGIVLCFLLLVACVFDFGDARYTSRGGYGSHHSSPTTHGSFGQKHTYPQSHSNQNYGPRSNQAHSYPSAAGSSRLSGGGNTHSYPPSGRLSGTGNSGYPVNTAQRYPHTGYANPTHNQYPGASGTNVHSYPPSRNGLSGTGHSNPGYPYPNPGGVPSGNVYRGGNNWPTNNVHTQPGYNYHPNTVHHHHYYEYRPPRNIYYGRGHTSYPVYTGALPTYVHSYRRSGNKFKYLLAGLALFNLAMVASNFKSHRYHDYYRPQRGERCNFGVLHDNGNYEEMGIDCRMMTNFIWAEENKHNHYQPQTKIINTQTVITNTTNYGANPPVVANTTSQVFDNSNGNQISNTPENRSTMPSSEPWNPGTNANAYGNNVGNGMDPSINNPTLSNSNVPINSEYNDRNYNNNVNTGNLVNRDVNNPTLSNSALLSNSENNNPNYNIVGHTNFENNDSAKDTGLPESISRLPRETVSNSVTSTTTEVIDAMDPRFNGDPVRVTPRMRCFVSRRTQASFMKKEVPCDLLNTYTEQSFVRSFGTRVGPSVIVLLLVPIVVLLTL